MWFSSPATARAADDCVSLAAAAGVPLSDCESIGVSLLTGVFSIKYERNRLVLGGITFVPRMFGVHSGAAGCLS
ncbi:hypothetical protein WL71_07625 [Burkholderia ubonensis]|uniref:Uncharacterized protein n=1 Tax=Burkholderia ubonensis TaxID=101571 RepID=A0A107FCC9_9BURK|nr:hypothetical protein WL70_01440 [Burkholderia ubonensis]KWD90915.1 hypothetical protein WL71_07625 [Burkholderia ubonensis]KWD98245.1 hypothetical protein WL73_19980 [Burkholderia ubonensis]KWE00580.1 hypothetical protein WL72_11470 [Burkholderia ubonensis]